MPRFRQLFSLLIFISAIFLSLPVHAAFIPRYDLESLCYMSTDVVEATIVRHHVAGHQEWDDRFTATVVRPIAGQYKSGDKIDALDLTLYNPNASGQRCILFLTCKAFQFYVQPSKTIPPRAVDMLLVDRHDRVWRYYQWSNPGGLTAAFGPLSSKQVASAADLERHLPMFAAERTAIAAKWLAVDRLRPLLSRPPRREDVPALQVLVQKRRYASGPGLQNVVSGVAQERLEEMHVKMN